jgi:hypothetical protein
LTLCTFVVVPSHEINESNSIEKSDDQGVWRKNSDTIFVFMYTISRPLCETSFVLRFFLTFVEISLKQNVITWVESFNFILVLFPFASYGEICRRKTPTFISSWNGGWVFKKNTNLGFCCNT